MSDVYRPCARCGLPVGCEPGDDFKEVAHLNTTYCKLIQAQTELTTLRAENERLRADAERFDYVAHRVTACDKEFYFVDLARSPNNWYHGSIREHFCKAIDAALTTEGQS